MGLIEAVQRLSAASRGVHKGEVARLRAERCRQIGEVELRMITRIEDLH